MNPGFRVQGFGFRVLMNLTLRTGLGGSKGTFPPGIAVVLTT